MTEEHRMRAATEWAKTHSPEFAALLASVSRANKPAMTPVNIAPAMPLTMAGPTTTGGTLRLMLHTRQLSARRLEHTGSTGIVLDLPPELQKART